MSYPPIVVKHILIHSQSLAKFIPQLYTENNVVPVHQSRVSSRRLRNAFWIIKEDLDRESYDYWKESLKNLASALSKARDIDVHIEMLITIQKQILKKDVREILEKFIEIFKNQRKELRNELLKEVKRFDSLKLIKDWEGMFTDQAIHNSDIQNSYIARHKIKKRLIQLLKLEKFVNQPDKAKELHEMRIAAKHLRYTLEIFESEYGRTLTSCLKRVYGIHRVLGDLHDLDVWIQEYLLNEEFIKNRDFSKEALNYLLNFSLSERAKTFRNFQIQWNSCRRYQVFEKLNAFTKIKIQ